MRAGRAAPNHKRTEPFTFKRLLWGSSSTERLAEIAEQVYLREKRNCSSSGAATPMSTMRLSFGTRHGANEKSGVRYLRFWSLWCRRRRRRQRRAVQRTIHHHSQATALRSAATICFLDSFSPYDPLPYAPPATERALEDYAAACAATQNVLLSLHAEGLATKWATGSVVKTPAFRALVAGRTRRPRRGARHGGTAGGGYISQQRQQTVSTALSKVLGG